MKAGDERTDVIRGALPLLFITLNLAFWIGPLILLALLKLLLPVPLIRKGLYRIMIGIYGLACQVDIFLFKVVLGIEFDVDSLDELKTDETYLIVSNHQSWADILVYQTVLINRTPIIKFIVKRELLFLPLIGLICWAYEYPMVERRSFKSRKKQRTNRKNDLDTLKDKLADIGRNPAAIINFAEGTRFNREKKAKYGSVHRNLLQPHTGGLFFILDTFGSQFDALLDFTVSYDCLEPVFFRFLGGRCRRVRVRVNRLPMPRLLQMLSDDSGSIDYGKVDAWLKDRWQQKDACLDRLIPN